MVRIPQCAMILLAIPLALTVWGKQMAPAETTRDEIPAAGIAEIQPPFGFDWGERDSIVKKVLLETKAKITNCSVAGGEEIVTATGLSPSGLKEALFIFKETKLAEVDLHYQSGDWTAATYDDFFRRVEKRIENQFGTGALIGALQTDQSANGNISAGYEWKRLRSTIKELKLWSSDSSGAHENISLRYQYLASDPGAEESSQPPPFRGGSLTVR